jgi:mono/diheme cytochrome c family protein
MYKLPNANRLAPIAILGLLASAAAIALLQSPVRAASDTAQAAESYEKGRRGVLRQNHCAICHGDQREGILPGFPPLVGIQHQLTDAKLIAVIRQGKGRMPGFPRLADSEVTSLVSYLATAPSAPAIAAIPNSKLSPEAAAGGAIFLQNCAFCHGRDAMGGETGPDLTQSKIVLGDKDGSAISAVVREGRIEKKMPAFQFSNSELMSLVAFIRVRVADAASGKGGRRGVEVADLQTGNAAAGKQYFNGAGGCSKCHSATGDLAGIANRFEGLRLEERMLNPGDTTTKSPSRSLRARTSPADWPIRTSSPLASATATEVIARGPHPMSNSLSIRRCRRTSNSFPGTPTKMFTT